MKRYIPIAEAFSRYGSMEDIDRDYPGIFDETGHKQHVKATSDGNWVVEDKQHTDLSNSRCMTAEEMREWMRGQGQ